MSDSTPSTFKLPILGEATEPSAKPGISRRGFLQILGSASVVSLAAGCARPDADTVAPYVTKPDDVVPGNPLRYATAMTLDGVATGLLVTAYEGRPTKVEGNPSHPVTKGATGLFEQASLLQLYDPTRTRELTRAGNAVSKQTFFAHLREKADAFKSNGGAGLRLLLEPSSSPLLASQLATLKSRFPNAVVRFHSPAAFDDVQVAANLAFGKPLVARHDLTDAKVIVSLDSDFLAPTAPNLHLSRQYADHRTDENDLSRLYVAECDLSLTGSNADHRFGMKSSAIGGFARALAAKVASSVGGPAAELASLGASTAFDKQIAAIAKDLLAHRGQSLVLVGERQPAAVQALGHALNAMLGNVGKTVSYAASTLIDPAIGLGSLKATFDEIAAGKVDTLILGAFDPMYASPGDLDIAAMLTKVPNAIYSSSYLDETAKRAEWVVPLSHYLESWGDTRAADGTVSLVQPLISPLYNSLTIEEVLSALLDPAPTSAHDLLRAAWAPKAGLLGIDAFWEKALKQGFVENTATPTGSAEPQWSAIAKAAGSIGPEIPGLEINFRPDYKLHDGRFGSNPWLIELPDPVTKLTWDNAVLISAATAAKLHLAEKSIDREQVVKVSVGGKTLPGTSAIYVIPGHADDAVTLPLGWGQGLEPGDGISFDTDLTLYGADENKLGFDAYAIRPSNGLAFTAGKVEPVDATYPLAQTQVHFNMEGRQLSMAIDVSEKEQFEKLEELRSDKFPSFYDPVPYNGYKWAMAIDLTRCTGCSACVVACISENNIPVVGKDNVRIGREMHWIRIDRYYEGTEKEPRVLTQPVACVHCENAPCEYVCPVNATTHSDEGLNEMTYNRCIGTRYCSNNCPYKVRRFNFFAYNNNKTPTEQMAFNPDVTVRSRGVMEKCTYCVQRIERARIGSEIAGRAIADGEIVTACQQACPTHAITFGSLNTMVAVKQADGAAPELKLDPATKTEVARLHGDARRYDLLNTLGTRPRTAYLARITNRNPELG